MNPCLETGWPGSRCHALPGYGEPPAFGIAPPVWLCHEYILRSCCHPGQCLDGFSVPSQQATNASRAKRAILKASPAPQSLRAAVQVIGSLSGREIRTGDLMKRQILRVQLLRGCLHVRFQNPAARARYGANFENPVFRRITPGL